MNIQEKIDKLRIEISDALQLLNKMHQTSINKDDVRIAIETHLGYAVFLRELEIELKEGAENKFSKDFLIKQFTNIHKSCLLVKEIADEQND